MVHHWKFPIWHIGIFLGSWCNVLFPSLSLVFSVITMHSKLFFLLQLSNQTMNTQNVQSSFFSEGSGQTRYSLGSHCLRHHCVGPSQMSLTTDTALPLPDRAVIVCILWIHLPLPFIKIQFCHNIKMRIVRKWASVFFSEMIIALLFLASYIF